MSEELHFDAHCHLFNARYLVEEAAAIAWYHSLHPSRYAGASFEHDDEEPSGPLEGCLKLIEWAAAMANGFFGAADEHLESLRDAYVERRLATAESFATMPLAMDIFYMFHEANASPAPRAYPQLSGSALVMPGLVQRVWDHARRQLGTGRDTLVHEAFSGARAHAMAAGQGRPSDVDLSPGYARHVRELVALQAGTPARVFPFLAVDPRRPGIERLIKFGDGVTPDGQALVSKSGPFCGIKLYPKLGFLPTDSALLPILAHCAEQDLPVLVHCATGGFPVENHLCYPEFAAPERWWSALAAHPKLRLCFAHFGGGNERWGETIEGFMARHENVYAGVACCTTREELERIQRRCVANPLVKERLLLGSDYDLTSAPGAELSLPEHLRQLEEVFESSAGLLTQMRTTNPRRYLGLS